ncbi:hypothetical protein F1559_002776 [Cyanidiococcus yangmingshanensis]|uniref:Uncharacterized protein n=1 Tax=Cyanidiococcus yangmingshanensis TaxID=2690220 RepID=A0A7J7IDH1_9RHOD|nr:hypothetical protein F1559_002776 [Cyanidiococcus yangmingshanensis]
MCAESDDAGSADRVSREARLSALGSRVGGLGLSGNTYPGLYLLITPRARVRGLVAATVKLAVRRAGATSWSRDATRAPWLSPTRLETRTKESTAQASIRAATPSAERKWRARTWCAPELGPRRYALRAPAAGHELFSERPAREPARWDPKDGELCLSRAKPEETLVEARSDSDVQIDRRTWV